MAGRSKQPQVPERRTVKLPYPQLSAREALGFAQTAMSEIGPDWFLANLATAGNLGLNGCLLGSPNSAWQFAYCRKARHDFVSGYLFSGGLLSFTSAAMSPEIQPLPIENQWLDSREIAKIVMTEPDLSDLSEYKTLWMALNTTNDGNLFWVVYRDTHQIASRQRARTTFGLDALSGEILSESYERWDRDVKIKTLLRHRRTGGDWKAAESDGGDESATEPPSSFH
jgi:hypothetical protein